MIILPDSHNPAFNHAIMTMRTFYNYEFFDYAHILSLVLIMRNRIHLFFLIMRGFSLLYLLFPPNHIKSTLHLAECSHLLILYFGFPYIHKSFQTPRCICRTCGWKHHCFYPRHRFNILDIQSFSCFPIYDYLLNL